MKARQSPMTRSTPLARGGFARRMPPKRPVKTVSDDFRAMPRTPAPAARLDGPCLTFPKFEYVRDTRLRDMCRAMACQHCGRSDPDAGITWSHSNQAIHGKGLSEKASDVFVAALCSACHYLVDQGKSWSQIVKVRVWDAAHCRTKLHALANGLWPKGIPCPGYEQIKES